MNARPDHTVLAYVDRSGHRLLLRAEGPVFDELAVDRAETLRQFMPPERDATPTEGFWLWEGCVLAHGGAPDFALGGWRRATPADLEPTQAAAGPASSDSLEHALYLAFDEDGQVDLVGDRRQLPERPTVDEIFAHVAADPKHGHRFKRTEYGRGIDASGVVSTPTLDALTDPKPPGPWLYATWDQPHLFGFLQVRRDGSGRFDWRYWNGRAWATPQRFKASELQDLLLWDGARFTAEAARAFLGSTDNPAEHALCRLPRADGTGYELVGDLRQLANPAAATVDEIFALLSSDPKYGHLFSLDESGPSPRITLPSCAPMREVAILGASDE